MGTQASILEEERPVSPDTSDPPLESCHRVSPVRPADHPRNQGKSEIAVVLRDCISGWLLLRNEAETNSDSISYSHDFRTCAMRSGLHGIASPDFKKH